MDGPSGVSGDPGAEGRPGLPGYNGQPGQQVSTTKGFVKSPPCNGI